MQVILTQEPSQSNITIPLYMRAELSGPRGTRA